MGGAGMREFGTWGSSGTPSVLVILFLSFSWSLCFCILLHFLLSMLCFKTLFSVPTELKPVGALVCMTSITGIIIGYFPFQILKENLLAIPQALNC